jgi:tRNA(fMet)-specific endonuclease VapC
LKKYLLDTNICIYFLKGLYQLDEKIKLAGQSNCFISEITVAELKFGAANSSRVKENAKLFTAFINKFTVLPIYPALDIYAKEKARLRKAGKPIDDFDLLIGSTAVVNKLILVTKNTTDFERIEKIKIKDWTLVNENKI